MDTVIVRIMDASYPSVKPPATEMHTRIEGKVYEFYPAKRFRWSCSSCL